ncbi:MAG: HYC_CC_PP family protein [Daejeonella sp.]
MKKSLSIKLKAVFLLVVFSLSTLVSFACAAGLDMGYNKNHHKIQDNPSLSERPGNNHIHSKKAHHEHSSADTEKVNDHKDEVAHHEKKEASSEDSSPDDCCRDEAAKFEKCDKLSHQAVNYNLQALFIILFINPIFNADAITASLHNPNSRYLIRNHHPPIADTRTAIQSFLI